MKGVTSFDSRAFWCKLPSWIRESLFLLLWNHPKSVMHVRRILWSVRLIIFIPYVYPSTPSHWLTCSRKRSLCLGSNPWTCVKTSISSMMVLHLNSVVFNYKTTTWPCLSGTTCSHVSSRTSSCLELAIVVHSPRISQRRLVDLCCKLSFFFLDLMSLEYSDTNQIWISGRCDGWNISQEL